MTDLGQFATAFTLALIVGFGLGLGMITAMYLADATRAVTKRLRHPRGRS